MASLQASARFEYGRVRCGFALYAAMLLAPIYVGYRMMIVEMPPSTGPVELCCAPLRESR